MSRGVHRLNIQSPASRAALQPAQDWRRLPVFRMVSRRWMLATLLVAVGILIMVRLGFWQLDRLEKRRSFNSRVEAQLAQPVLVLDATTADLKLQEMEYRSVIVRGKYDFSRQVALRNQAWNNQWGIHLLTPLKVEGVNTYILVDRGWVPAENFTYDDWAQYDENGIIEVRGVIRASQDKPDFGSKSDPIPAAGDAPLLVWNFANVEGIGRQVPFNLLPVYIQQTPDETWKGLPYRTQAKLELTEGPHLGYAIQWFIFAAILGLGYPLFIQKQERPRAPASSLRT